MLVSDRLRLMMNKSWTLMFSTGDLLIHMILFEIFGLTEQISAYTPHKLKL